MSSAGGGGRGKVTFDLTLEIIHIIWELLSQIPKSAPDADIMQINASSKKVRIILLPFLFYVWISILKHTIPNSK